MLLDTECDYNMAIIDHANAAIHFVITAFPAL